LHDPVSCRNPQDRSRKRAAVELPPRPFGASGGGDTDSSARAVTCSSSRHRLAGVCDRRREATEQRAQIILGWKARGSGELAWKRARLPLLSAYDPSAVDDRRTATTKGRPVIGADALGRAGRTRQHPRHRRQARCWGCAPRTSTPRVRRAPPLSCDRTMGAQPQQPRPGSTRFSSSWAPTRLDRVPSQARG
jgi:hypothetical protein